MSYGLQVVGAGGAVQIDQDYQNLLYISSGTVAAGSASTTVAITSQLPYVPQVFVRPQSSSGWVGGYVFHDQFNVTCDTACDWVAFGFTSQAAFDPSGTWGLQVFAANGTTTAYDSRYECVRVQQTLNISGQTYPDGLGGGSTYPSYPATFTISGWGTRPWISLNSLLSWFDDQGTDTVAQIASSTQISIATATWVNGWQFGTTNGSNGYFNRSFPGGAADFPILRRYTD